MTQEEKARAYDEALKEAVIAHKDEDMHLKATLERIFPEIKESEDERIRKEMISWLKGFIGEEEGCGYTEDEIRERIAWLEKQGEQKPNKCMYSNGNYTDEDRKVLCDGCEEDCKLKHKQWKPSEEQLQALRWVCNRTFIAQEPQKKSALEDLYEQLMELWL